jgi:hypothetical protein
MPQEFGRKIRHRLTPGLARERWEGFVVGRLGVKYDAEEALCLGVFDSVVACYGNHGISASMDRWIAKVTPDGSIYGEGGRV